MDFDGGEAPAHEAVRYARRPDTLRGLRACRGCRLIKTLAQFQAEFCDNCWRHWADGEPAVALKHGRRLDYALENTTPNYEGMVAMMRPHDSWAAKWLQMGAWAGKGEGGARGGFR